MIAPIDKLMAPTAGGMVAVVPVADSPWIQFGLAGLVVGVVIYQSWQRETRMATRIDLLEDRQDEVLVKNVAVLEQVASAMREHNVLLHEMLRERNYRQGDCNHG